MTLESLFLEHFFLQQDTIVKIAVFACGEYVVVASGHWYEAKILNYSRRKINSYYVNLVDDVITINVEGDLII